MRTTVFVAGSIRSSVFSRWFSTQTYVPSKAKPAGPSPTGSRATCRFVRGSTRSSGLPGVVGDPDAPRRRPRGTGRRPSSAIWAATRFVPGRCGRRSSRAGRSPRPRPRRRRSTRPRRREGDARQRPPRGQRRSAGPRSGSRHATQAEPKPGGEAVLQVGLGSRLRRRERRTPRATATSAAGSGTTVTGTEPLRASCRCGRRAASGRSAAAPAAPGSGHGRSARAEGDRLGLPRPRDHHRSGPRLGPHDSVAFQALPAISGRGGAESVALSALVPGARRRGATRRATTRPRVASGG